MRHIGLVLEKHSQARPGGLPADAVHVGDPGERNPDPPGQTEQKSLTGENTELMRARITQLWQTRMLRYTKLTVADEIEVAQAEACAVSAAP